MSSVYQPLPSSNDINIFFDSRAHIIRFAYPLIGLNLPSEISGGNALTTSAQVGLSVALAQTVSNATLLSSLITQDTPIIQKSRIDNSYKQGALINTINQLVTQNLPKGYPVSSYSNQAIDNWLIRTNGTGTTSPRLDVVSANPATVSAVYNIAGQIAPSSSGNCPRIVLAMMGPSWWMETVPSVELSQVSITSTKNALQVSIAGTVPVGVNYLVCYRGLAGGSTGTYYLDQIVKITSGSSFPLVTFVNPDYSLNQGSVPVNWMNSLQLPEAAMWFAWCYSLANPNAPNLYIANNMMSAVNVAMNSSNMLLGPNQLPITAIFSSLSITGSGPATTITAGTPLLTNEASVNNQGFIGATGIQYRVLSTHNAAFVLDYTYTYYDAVHGYGNIQTTGAQTQSISSLATGNVTALPITSGQIVTSVTITGATGSASSGNGIVEAIPVRP